MKHKDKQAPNTSITPINQVNILISEHKKSVCVGINDYPGTGSDLKGCLNDAKGWDTFLTNKCGFNSYIMLDKNATVGSFTEHAGNYITDSKAGDVLVLTYSGHGTNVPDQNGDEEDGRDEALCLYDGFLIDDALRDMFKNIHPEATLTFISDSCHSGTVTRAFMKAMKREDNPVPRYLPPQDDYEALGAMGSNINGRIFYPEENMKEILITGCLPTEYSYDAKLGGQYNGAMSYWALNILNRFPLMSYEDFYKKLRAQLPSGQYPQTPQLEASEENKKKIMFT